MSMDINYRNETNQVDLSVILHPSKAGFFKDRALIGELKRINKPYELLSFRIEDNSTTHVRIRR